MTSLPELVIRLAGPADLDWVNARYREIDFLPSSADELIALAQYRGQAAGLGRVVPVSPGVGELGGMHVLPAFQGMGLARHIIRFLLENTDAQLLYCLPFAPLRALYESMGFTAVIDQALVPEAVMSKYHWCNQHYPDPVLLLQCAVR